MYPSPSVRVLNWLGDRPWVSDAAWWRLSDAHHAAAHSWRSGRAPDGRVWLDVQPYLALALSRRASRVLRRVHVRTDPTCELTPYVPRSRWLDVRSRAYACPACTSMRRGRELLDQLRASSQRLADEVFRPRIDTPEGRRRLAEDVTGEVAGLGSTAEELRRLVPMIYAHDPERAEALLRRAADELDALHARQ